MTEYEEFLRQEAPRRGIDIDVAIRAANTEGGLKEAARLGDFSGPPWFSGKSWWAYQLHYGGAEYASWGGSAGMGNSFTKLTGWAPGDPRAWRDAMRYALDAIRRGGWGPWYGPRAIGITGFHGVNRAVPWNGTPDDEWDYKKGIMADVTDEVRRRVLELARKEIGKRYAGPIVGEPDSYRWGNPGWDCSSFVSAMYDRATNGQVKLTAYTDAAVNQSEWVKTPRPGDIVFYHYEDEQEAFWPHMGLWLSPTEVLDARFGKGVGVHPHVTPIGPDAAGRYRTTMTPKGLSKVVLEMPTTPPPVTPVVDPRDEQIAALRAEVEGLRTVQGYLTHNVVDALQAAVDELKRHRPA